MPESTIEEKKLRVVAVDDSKPMLDMIVKLLTPHFEVVGIATDGNAAEELIKLLKPDIAVLDISMAGGRTESLSSKPSEGKVCRSDECGNAVRYRAFW